MCRGFIKVGLAYLPNLTHPGCIHLLIVGNTALSPKKLASYTLILINKKHDDMEAWLGKLGFLKSAKVFTSQIT